MNSDHRVCFDNHGIQIYFGGEPSLITQSSFILYEESYPVLFATKDRRFSL